MTNVAAPFARGARAVAVPLSFAIALFGVAVYGLLLWRSTGIEPGAFGTDIYDQMWLAIRDGRLDLPARVLRHEGHYWPNGTAMLYHGLAPLITRMLLDPFVTIGAVSFAPVSLWLWSSLGSAAWQAAFLTLGCRNGAPSWLLSLIGVAVWFGGAGLLLTANNAFYHEPIALAYATTGAFVLVWVRAVEAGRFPASALVLLAWLAALTVHARPNLAIGLYFATGVAVLQALHVHRRALVPGALAALAILFASGAGYLGLNTLRFGVATQVHGSFAAGEIQYGAAFWGVEVPGNPRQQAFEEHGRFNPARILPNALMYLAAPPEVLVPRANAKAQELHVAATLPWTGYGRVESPSGGILFLWPFWVIIAAVGLGALARHRMSYGGLVAGLMLSGLVTLSYATITLRYHADLWPVLAALGLLGMAALADGATSSTRALLMALALGAGLTVSAMIATSYAHMFRTDAGTGRAEWTEAECIARAEAKGLDEDRVAYVCRDPLVEQKG